MFFAVAQLNNRGLSRAAALECGRAVRAPFLKSAIICDNLSIILQMIGSVKNFIQWRHERGTWQYDIFCLLIVAFIFLTPKTWFDKKEKLATQTARLIVKAQDFSPDKNVMEKRVKELSGDKNAQILDWRETKNAAGETIYEIDIR